MSRTTQIDMETLECERIGGEKKEILKMFIEKRHSRGSIAVERGYESSDYPGYLIKGWRKEGLIEKVPGTRGVYEITDEGEELIEKNEIVDRVLNGKIDVDVDQLFG